MCTCSVIFLSDDFVKFGLMYICRIKTGKNWFKFPKTLMFLIFNYKIKIWMFFKTMSEVDRICFNR